MKKIVTMLILVLVYIHTTKAQTDTTYYETTENPTNKHMIVRVITNTLPPSKETYGIERHRSYVVNETAKTVAYLPKELYHLEDWEIKNLMAGKALIRDVDFNYGSFNPWYMKMFEKDFTYDGNIVRSTIIFSLLSTMVMQIGMAIILVLLFNTLFIAIKIKNEGGIFEAGYRRIFNIFICGISTILLFGFSQKITVLTFVWTWINLPNLLIILTFIVIIAVYHVRQFMDVASSELADDY